MNTLDAISPPSQGSGLVQSPPPKSEETKAATSAIDPTLVAVQAKLPEQNNPENKQQISNAVKEINNFFQTAQRTLDFSIDEASGHMVMQIKDSKTNELIRQIPGEDALMLAKRLDDVKGVLFKARA